MAKLAEKTGEVFAYLQAHDTGEGVSIAEIAEAVGREPRSVLPSVTLGLAAKKDGSRPALAIYEKRDEGGEKPVGYAVLTEEGRNFVDEDDEE